MIEYIFPKKVVEFNKVENASNLLIKKPLQIGLAETVVSNFKKGSYIILDFGKEMNGSVRIETFSSEGKPIRIRFGESLMECYSSIGEKNSTNDHALRDFKTVLPDYSDLTFGNTGFRFVRLDFEGNNVIKNIICVNKILRKKVICPYTGNDNKIKKIFDCAKRTVDLCAAGDYVWDGVKRDRLVWVGDMHPEMLALSGLYGEFKALERSLDFVKEQTPLPQWMNNFPMYSMWWIIIVSDYRLRTKSDAFAKEQLGYLQGLLKQMNECVLENGDLNYPFYFVDWPTHEKPDEMHGVRAINIIACKKAIELLQYFSEDTSVAEEMLKKLLKQEIKPESSKQVLGLKYFATELTEQDKKKLIKNGAKGMSTFMSYYILKAVASFDKEKAISMMKDYYGAMLKKGATTFWEDFDLDWVNESGKIDAYPTSGQKDIHGDYGAYCYMGFRHSLCHGWSAGVIAFIQEECNA